MEKYSSLVSHHNINNIDVTESPAIRDSNEKVHRSLVSLIDVKDNVISQQEAVIKSLKETIETTKRTVAHKEEVIAEQAIAIISLKTDCEYNSTDGDGDIGNCNIKLAEANSAIEGKHNEVKNYQSQLQNAYQDNSKLTDEIGSLREILEEDKFNLSEQKKRLHEPMSFGRRQSWLILRSCSQKSSYRSSKNNHRQSGDRYRLLEKYNNKPFFGRYRSSSHPKFLPQ